MPLLKGKILTPAKPVVNMGPTDTVYVIPHTGEQFLSKEEFEKRQALYRDCVWTCQCTGAIKLSHKDAMESERKVRELLAQEFPKIFEKQVLELVHNSSNSLDNLVDEAWRSLHEFFTIGESVTLKVKAHGKIIRGTVVKIEQIIEKPNGEDDSPAKSKPKETADSPRKPPKLHPCKYGVRIEEEDKIINSIPSFDLVRETKLPKKDVIRFFIRSHAVRSGNPPDSLWIVEDEMIDRYCLVKKAFVAGDNHCGKTVDSPAKRKARSHSDENCMPSKKRKLENQGKTKKKKDKVIADNQKKLCLSSSFFGSVGLSKMNDNKKDTENRPKENLIKTGSKPAIKSSGKITSFINGLKRSDSITSSSSSCEVPLAKLKEKIGENSSQVSVVASSTPLRQSLDDRGRKKCSVDQINISNESRAKKSLSKELLEDDSNDSCDMPLSKLKKSSENGVHSSCHKNEVSVHEDGLAKLQESPSKSSKTKESVTKVSSDALVASKSISNRNSNSSASSSKKQLKQMTLFDMKGQKEKASETKITPRKNLEKCSTPSSGNSSGKSQKGCKMKLATEKSVQKSPKTPAKETPKKSSDPHVKTPAALVATPVKNFPPIVLRLQKVNKETNAHLYAQLLARCVRELSDKQIQALPDDLRSVILPKSNMLKEKKKLELMTPAEREAYMLKKKEELRQKMKNKFAESRKRYEDTDLELKPIPIPKIVPTPDGLANELFGDVAMVSEFISCFRGLLMTSDSKNITSEGLMMALVAGKIGFSYLSRVLCILLQTLLQDKLVDEYRELRVPLSEIPVSEHTASELVRLCLRRFDAQLSDSDDGSSVDDNETNSYEDNEVPEALIEQLETSEFYELEVEAKVQILVGLCNRIMGSYSVQDYMDEKQQEASELWKRRLADLKEKKNKMTPKKNKIKKPDLGSEKSNDDALKSTAAKGSGLTINHFYGEKTDVSKSTSLNSNNNQPDEEEDMLSAIKRRRKTAEERKQKEAEERLQKEKERSKMIQIREDLIFEDQFKKGIALAKSVVRHCPVGLDRNQNRYWILHGSLPGLYVEKGWSSREAEYTVQLDVSSSSESDSDGRSTESGIHSGTSDLVKGSSVEKTIPHIGQNLWFMFDSVEEINLLIEGLHPLGVRESSLKDALKKNYNDIVKRINSSSSKVSDIVEENGSDERLIKGLREEMLDLELRLVHGGLGGVTDLPVWEKKLADAKEIKDFGECLADIQMHVLPKFVKGLLATNDITKKKKADDNEDRIKVEENDIKVDEKKVNDGLKMWLEAVGHCSTFSRLHVLMGILENCIKWEKSAENMKCRICRRKGDEEYLLLCDDCNMPFHLFCLRPVLQEVPVGEWFCPACSPERSNAKGRSNMRVRKETDESDDEDEGIADTEHEQECAICGDDSDLIHCSTCPSSFHLDCHDPPLRHMPRTNTWKCMQCKTGVRIRKSKRNRGLKRKNYADSDAEEAELEPPVRSKKLERATTVSDLRRKDSLELRESSSSRQHNQDDVSDRRQTRSAEFSKPAASRSSKRQVAEETELSPENSLARTSSVHVVVTRLEQDFVGKSKQKSTSSNAKINKQMILDLIDRLRKHRHSWPFLEPVDIDDAPDYYAIIANPIDLRTMEDKCISDVYCNSQQFIADFALMLRNAEQYNTDISAVGRCIEPMDKFFESIVGRYIPESKYQIRQWFSSRSG